MAKQDSIKVVEIQKAIELIAVTAFAVLVATIFIWTIYSFGYSRGEDHGRMLSSVGGSGICSSLSGTIICCGNGTCSRR